MARGERRPIVRMDQKRLGTLTEDSFIHCAILFISEPLLRNTLQNFP